jgi:hypothetical protein
MKSETIRRKFRKYGVKFSGFPDESPRQYAPSDCQRTHHAEYPVALSTRHEYFNPRVRYQKVEMPAQISARLTKYALDLINNKFPVAI